MLIEHDVTIITCSDNYNDNDDKSRSKEKKDIFVAAVLLYDVLDSALL